VNWQQLRIYQPQDLPWLQNRIACPAPWPHYVVPGSHMYDPVYYQRVPPFPFPRAPWPYESETRAPGTGLLDAPPIPPCPPPCPPPPFQSQQQSARPQWAAQALSRWQR
jgi:hypothetical protein